MSEEFKETKLIAVVPCPACEVMIEVKRERTYDQKKPRRKVDDRYFAEKAIQTTL